MKAKITSPGRETIELEAGGAITIGRDPTVCCIVVAEDTRVSKLHARVFHEGGRYFVEDCGSRNGTFVNDRRVVARLALRHLDVIAIGGTEFQFALAAEEPLGAHEGVRVGSSVILASLDAGTKPPLLRGESLPPGDFRDPHVRLKCLYMLGEKLASIRSTRKLFADLLEEVFRILPVDRGVVLCRTPEGTLEVVAQASRISQDDDEIRVSSTLLLHAFDERRALLIPDASQDHDLSGRTSILTHQIRSIACVPMIAPQESDSGEANEVVGLLQVHSVKGGLQLGEPELELLVGIGNIAAVSFQNAKSHQEQIQRNRQLEMVHQLEKILLEGDRFGAFTQSALQKALEALEARWGLLSLEDGSTASLQFASSVPGEEGVTTLPRAIDWEGLIDDASGSGETRLQERIRDEATGAQWSACAVPILSVEEGDDPGRHPMGALLVVCEGASPISSADRALMGIFSTQISAALYRRRFHIERETTKRLTTIGRLSSSIIHDFGAPMTAIRGYAEILAGEPVDPETQKRYCQLIRKCVDRCVTMTTELLRFSRGEKNFRFIPVDSKMFMLEMASLLENEMRRKGVLLEVRDEYRGLMVIDVDKMQRVLFNLSSNALDVLKEGDHFRVVVQNGGGCPRVVVEDTGPGIPHEIRETLFEPFVTHGKKHGTGLGLAIAREIISGHRGRIHLDPAYTGGSRFIIDLDPGLEPTG